MKKYISTFVLIIIVLLLVGAIGYSFKLVIQKDKDIAALTQQNEDLKTTITELNTRIESIQDEQQEESNEELTGIIPSLDESKIVNKPDNTSILENIYDNNGTISISVDNENNSLNIVLDSQMARQIYGYNGQTENHTIAGISGKIIDAKIVSTGNDANGVKVVILLESGEVKYINVANILDKTYTVKTVSNAKNIMGFVEISMNNTETKETTFAVVGIKTDGTAIIFEFE